MDGEDLDNPVTESHHDWIAHFPILHNIDTAARSILTHSSKVLPKAAGAVVFREGQLCESFMLVVKGVIRVHKKSNTGKEMVLYRIKAGEACGLTMSSLVTDTPCFANAVAETDARAKLTSDTSSSDAPRTSNSSAQPRVG